MKLHNNFAQARYRMGLVEQKIFLYALSQINQDKEDFNIVYLNLKILAEKIGVNYNTFTKSENLKMHTRKIMQTIIEAQSVENPNVYMQYNLTSQCTHVKNEGITLKFNPDMKPLLLELKEHYFVQHPAVIQFKSWNSIRLYDFIEAMTHKYSEYTIEIEELKGLLRLEGKYARFNTFREKVISPALKEINSKTNLNIAFEKVLLGKSTHSIKFTFTKHEVEEYQVKKEMLDAQRSVEDIKEMRKLCNFETEQFTDVEMYELYYIAVRKVDSYDYDVFEYIQANHQFMCEKLEGIESKKRRYGYLKKALENSYGINLNQLRIL